jgi:hypothetical protein
MGRARETVLFATLTLLLSWAIGWMWIRYPEKGWLTQWMMWAPGLVGLGLSWVLRREPPAAAGLGLGSPGPWLVAFLYPFFLVAVAVVLGYAVRLVTGDARFIYFQPEAVMTGGWLGLPRRPGLSLVWLRLLRNVWLILPWLLVAVVYQKRWPERLQAALPPRLRFLHHGVRWGLAGLVLWAYPGPLAPPGAIGEELGWRGTLVRWWADRPLMAVALTAPLWALFHVPVALAPAQAGHLLQNVVFLGSIAASAAPFVALYVWSRSVWPCVVLHFNWNFWNPFLLGDVYGDGAGVFGGALWAINGEGLFGLLINGAVSAGLIVYWRRRSAASTGSGHQALRAAGGDREEPVGRSGGT